MEHTTSIAYLGWIGESGCTSSGEGRKQSLERQLDLDLDLAFNTVDNASRVASPS